MNNSLVNQATSINQIKNQVDAGHQTSVQSTQALAEVQGRIFMARQFPRDYELYSKKIESACGRMSLAKIAEYKYARSGSVIQGPTIKLLETIAQCYGNVQFGWKELYRDSVKHVSFCKSEAWDLETNVSSSMEFEVSHYRDKKNEDGIIMPVLVTAERDIYELMASQAARRTRKCLETIIPRDIIDDAREVCNTTLVKGIDVNEALEKAIAFFQAEYKVNLKQLEKYFGYTRREFTVKEYSDLVKLKQSIEDKVVFVNELFPPEKTNLKGNVLVEEETETATIQPKSSNKKEKSLFDNATKLEA